MGRAVRHPGSPARRSTPPLTSTRCPTVAESASAEKRRMAAAAYCDRVRAPLEVLAARASIDSPDRRRGPPDYCRERPGPPLEGPNGSFSPKFAPGCLASASCAVSGLRVNECDIMGSRESANGPKILARARVRANLGENEPFGPSSGGPGRSLQWFGGPRRRSGPSMDARAARTSSGARTRSQ